MDGRTSGLLPSPSPLPFQPTEDQPQQQRQQQGPPGASEGSSLVATTPAAGIAAATAASSLGGGNVARPAGRRARDVACALSYLLSLASVVLVSVWVSDDAMGGGGVSWRAGDAKRVFNWHPVMMVCTFAVMTASALAFRAPAPPPPLSSSSTFLRRGGRGGGVGGGVYDRPLRKSLHGIGWAVAAMCGSVGLVAVFRSHNDAQSGYIANLYSLHSWVGISAVILYVGQFVVGLHFFALRLSWIGPDLRRRAMVAHRFVGSAIYFVTAFAVLLGIQEKEGFVGCSYSVSRPDTVPFQHVGDIPRACMVSHALGFVVLITALCTGFVLNDSYGGTALGGGGGGSRGVGVGVGVGSQKDGVV